MNVLSLFDGMSCGQIALSKLGVPVGNYFASEIDQPAIQVARHNFPNTQHLGDVQNWKNWDIDWASIDLLIAGSPCQGFSFAGKQLAFDDPRSKLFFTFVDILRNIQEFNPDVKFLLENVRMKKDHLQVISETLRVEPMFINSSLVCAQNRPRYYWFNWVAKEPEDKGIVLADILEKEVCSKFNLKNSYKGYLKLNPQKSKLQELQDSLKPRIRVDLKPRMLAEIANDTPSKRSRQTDRVYCISSKSPCLLATRSRDLKVGTESDVHSWRNLTPKECERLQTVPDGYTATVPEAQRYRMLGNGWTVDVVKHLFSQAGFKAGILGDLF